MNLSIIIPAFNEVDYLPATLDSIRRASERLRDRADVGVEVIVVDNNSTDDTTAVAEDQGATVVGEPVQGIGRARNCGASVAEGDVLVFVDADVIVPVTLLEVVHEVMSDPGCIGGGVDVEYRPRRLVIRLYLRCWRQLARLTGMVQGATQFCRRSAFDAVGGYDESVWIGEDVDFLWSLKKLARGTGQRVQVVRKPRVLPSTRRFDKMPVWKVLLFTNPLFIALFRRWKAAWADWYKRPVR
ncbi:MAG: glycosyltransferase [Dehalococcoidia bacterium]|nr:glycosyltransferase [Dehalococcoidia bacterium]